MSGPVIGGTYTSPQAVTDGQPFNAFGNVTLTDAGSSGAETATITMTNAGVASDNNGTLTGAGLSKTATGTYTLTADSPADLQAALRAVVFTPTELGGTANLATGLTLQVSDGVAPAVTDTNTVIYTLLGSVPLSAIESGVSGEPNQFVSATRTGETVYATTPVSQTENASATNITAVLNGQTVYQQSFDLPYTDPTVQAAVAQANNILAADGATASTPALTATQVTNETPQNMTVITGEQTASPVIAVKTYFGPGQLFTGLDINGTPNTNFSIIAGQEDTNVNSDYQTTIDQTVTTTTTQLTTQDYTITGTPAAGPVIGGTYTSPQAVTDGQPFNAFGNVILTDAGSSGAETATITMTNAGVATDDNGTLTGTGLSKTATGTYTLTAGSPADLQAALRAVVFTPTDLGGTGNLATGLTLQVSDGVAAPVTDTNTVIDTVLGPQPLTAAIEPVANDPNAFTSQTRTAETVYANTPVSQTDDTSATVITAVLNGQTVYQQSFDLPYSDPAVQAAVAQADQILAADNATASTPGLTSSQVTDQGSQTTTVVTGQQTSTVRQVTTNFGPGPLFNALDVNGTPNTTVTLLAGQEDTNVNSDYQTTIDQTVTTTTTQLTTQDYTITGTESATCFAAGTNILTAKGRVRVEDLRIGDVVPTLHGGGAQIKWIGRRDYDGRFIAGNHLMLPVRIKRNALARNIPSRDLIVSPGHGIYLDGVFVPAWRLVNGVSITQAKRVESVSYFHIELADHAVIFAEDCPVESFLDDGCRRQFANGSAFDDLYPYDAGGMVSCAPRAEHGFQLDGIQRSVAARAGVLMPAQKSGVLRGFVDEAGPAMVTGWAQFINDAEAPVCLDVLVRGHHAARLLANQYRADLRAAGLGSGCHAFCFALPQNIGGPVEVLSSFGRTMLPKTTAAEVLAA
jgi:hypothetical protein